jgi:prevent-host-death family protein
MATKTYGAEEARAHLPELLERAHHGTPAVITKRGKPYATLGPICPAPSTKSRATILSLKGSGKGLWGPDAADTVAKMRREWR